MSAETLTLAATQEKAFRINMDRRIYGTFAEIGAGQETANWFFRSSGAAGTVAKTISAYDMTVSDTLYGPVRRYVSQERLEQMMDYEYTQLINRLGEKRGAETCFFSFCNTVKCKGYRDNGPWSAWIGVRFQLRPEAPPSDFVMHVRLLVPDHDIQMRILGILGVNLLHALFYKREHMNEFVNSVADNLDRSMYEVDFMRFSGHGFTMFDNRLLALELVIYPIFAFLDRFPAFTTFTTQRKTGEFKQSLLLAFHMFIAAVLVCWTWLGDRYLVLASMYAWGVGDAFAALVGKKFGRHKLPFKHVDRKKSVEGSLAMFLTSAAAVLAVLLIRGGLHPAGCVVVAAAAAGVSTLVEMHTTGGYDTITCPTASLLTILPLMALLGGLT